MMIEQVNYKEILREELLPASGCTEPAAVAFCAAKLRSIFDGDPTRIVAHLSGNILKNVRSVIVPNTNGAKGVPVAVAAGFVVGNPEKGLLIISHLTKSEQAEINTFLGAVPIEIRHMETPCALDIVIEAYGDTCHASVRIANYHTNIVHMEKNGTVLFDQPVIANVENDLHDRSGMTIEGICEYAEHESIENLRELLCDQIRCNAEIAEEGIRNSWGSQIGRTLLLRNGIESEACAYAAAGSDARMSGCRLPVVILSGSGNQGITAVMPVIRYAKNLNAAEDRLYRAVAVSDLVTLHIKDGIGRLSAFCGAICAGVGAGAGIAYLHEQSTDAVRCTVSNACAILAGVICDGAKASCAAKIAEAVNAGILGFQMYQNGHDFCAGDGIVGINPEQTIQNVGTIGKQGMVETDRVILRIMESGSYA